MLALSEDPNVEISALAYVRQVGLAVAVLIAIGLASAPAFAADAKVEKDAQALQKKAIEEDYLNVDYAAAVKNLKAAALKCGGDKCKPSVKGAILRDLGAMQILGGTLDEGKLSFTQALSIDASLDLDPAYKVPQLTTLWNDAKKSAPPPAPPPAPPTPTPTPTVEPPSPPTPPSGDFTHSPPSEVLVRTPLAIYVDYSGSEELGHVVAKYKGFGMTEWKTLELKKLDKGFGALIPCTDVAQGPLQYYLQGFNAQNDQVAASGSRSKPITLSVKPQIAGTPAGLPGQPPPVQCEDKSSAECPPDFPGCKSLKKQAGAECGKDIECESGSCDDGKCAEKKEAGESCQAETECKSGSCADGKCVARKGEGEDCESSDECDSDRCKNGKCVLPLGAVELRRIWLGVSLQADWFAMPAGSNVCVLPVPTGVQPQPISTASNTGYSCVDSSGSRFPTTDANGLLVNHSISQQYDKVTPGFALGNIRILASFDYALNTNMLVGARAGYVALTDPLTGAAGSPFPPIHLEARFTYLFGHDALTAQTIAPLIFAGVGAGEFDAYVPVKVVLTPDPKYTPMGPYATAQTTTVHAWQTAGPIFISAGAGARIALGPAIGLTGALKVEGAFGGTAASLWGVAPEVGVQFGL
jgi:hypothetical protein